MMAMTYGNVYVARVAMGANDAQTVKAFLEAEAYDGPSLIIAYSHCIAHGYRPGARPRPAEGRRAVGLLAAVPLQPRRSRPQGKNPLQLDSKPPSHSAEEYVYNEDRYTMLAHSEPGGGQARCSRWRSTTCATRWQLYAQLAAPARRRGRRRRRHDMIDLSTTLPRPRAEEPAGGVGVAAGEDLDNIRRMEDAGAAAVVLPSLFEEQIALESARPGPRTSTAARRASPRRSATSRTSADYNLGARRLPGAHPQGQGCRWTFRSSRSLNGISIGGWVALRQARSSRPAPTPWS